MLMRTATATLAAAADSLMAIGKGVERRCTEEASRFAKKMAAGAEDGMALAALGVRV